VVTADGLLVWRFEQAVHLAVRGGVQLDLADAELVGMMVVGVGGELCDDLAGQVHTVVKVHEPRHVSFPSSSGYARTESVRKESEDGLAATAGRSARRWP